MQGKQMSEIFLDIYAKFLSEIFLVIPWIRVTALLLNLLS